jgi:hypothetical protein
VDRVFQVFVSSTFTDLEEERRLVSNSLAKAGYLVAGMELFPATDQDQFEYIKRIIDRSDYYVVITAGRYGSVTNDGLSYTEKEFEYARSQSIPVLALLHANPGSLATNKSEQDDAGRAKLKRFNEKLKTGRLTDFWSNKDELCTKAVIAVSNSVNLTPGLGWVRGDNAIDPKVLQEAERLRVENAELKEKLAKLQGSLAVEFDPTILGPETSITITIKETALRRPAEVEAEENYTVSTTFKEIFIKTYDELLREPTEDIVDGIIGRAFARKLNEENAQPFYSYSCSHDETVTIRNQLEPLGLIETKAKIDPFGVNRAAWIVTEKGRRYFASHSALRPV